MKHRRVAESLAYLNSIPISAVKDIGARRAKRLTDAGIASVAQLLLHVPRRYLDRSQLFDLTSVPLGEEVTVGGVVQSVSRRRISRNRTMVEANIGDGTSTLHAVWFNPYLKLEKGEEVAISGKAELFRGRLQMKAPDLDRLDQEDALVTGRVVPVHPSVGGMKPMKLREAVANALRRSRPITEVVPADILSRLDLVGRDRSIATIHFPEDHVEAGRPRGGSSSTSSSGFRSPLPCASSARDVRRRAGGIVHGTRCPAASERFSRCSAVPS